MSKIEHNIPKVADATTMSVRGAVEHRATWMALLLDEMKKQGGNFEEVGRNAIRKCGHIHGEGYKGQCKDSNDASEFAKVFFNEQGSKNMEIEIIEADYDHVIAEFSQCPLVQAWEKLGYEGEDLKLLCDMAMDGDRGIADQMGLKLDITKTIAAGDKVCRLRFHK